MSRKVSDYLTIPLCRECHDAMHGKDPKRRYLIDAKMDENDFLREIIKRMGEWIREH